jgi:cytidine deaminase
MPSPEGLIAAAQAARERAYAPYSEFSVGAAVETASGAVFTGCNVENASYSVGLCAERVAVARAVAEGHRAFRAIAVAGPTDTAVVPCGACRQFMAEFEPALVVIYTAPKGVVRTTLAELLPSPFGPHSLK